MQPAVSLLFFLFLVFQVVFMLITERTIWRGIIAIHKDDCPIFYWFHVCSAAIPAVILPIYCWRDWLALLT